MKSTTHVLYLHGFRSGPLSAKAQWLAKWLGEHHPQVHWRCPQLPVSARMSAELIQHTLQDWPAQSTVVIGSSLGGFYATWAAAMHGCAAVVLNPAVHPSRDLAAYIGTHTAWHDDSQRVEVTADHLREFYPLYVGDGLRLCPDIDSAPLADPARILAMVATGDEVLDWQEMLARYPSAQTYVIPGSDHGISDFAQHIGVLSAFLFGS